MLGSPNASKKAYRVVGFSTYPFTSEEAKVRREKCRFRVVIAPVAGTAMDGTSTACLDVGLTVENNIRHTSPSTLGDDQLSSKSWLSLEGDRPHLVTKSF